MNASQPSRMATALLRRWLHGLHIESLEGDLIEQYQNGRSAGWYWRQVLIAIVLSAVEEIRTHPIEASRALMIGWALLWWGKHHHQLMNKPGHAVSAAVSRWLLTNGHDSLRGLWFRFHVQDMPVMAIWWLTCAGIGWSVTYAYRRQQPLIALLFTVSVFVTDLPRICGFSQLALAAGDSGTRVLLLVPVLNTLVSVTSLLFGGLVDGSFLRRGQSRCRVTPGERCVETQLAGVAADTSAPDN